MNSWLAGRKDRSVINTNTIFDFGMHKGDDAAYYLSKGFKAVSVDAFRDYIELARVRFAEELR